MEVSCAPQWGSWAQEAPLALAYWGPFFAGLGIAIGLAAWRGRPGIRAKTCADGVLLGLLAIGLTAVVRPGFWLLILVEPLLFSAFGLGAMLWAATRLAHRFGRSRLSLALALATILIVCGLVTGEYVFLHRPPFSVCGPT